MNKRKILVPLGDKSYEVTLEAGILNNISEELLKIGITKNRKILVISNEEISNLYGEKFLNNLKDNKFQAKMFLIKAGESYKNLKTLSEIYDVAFEFGLDRNSIIIALGGGIVGDVSGFAAATWLRGIEYIQIPTTLLSMVDSSVGGKTGVNHPKGKNLIGAFNQPKAVFIDPETLKSLPKREFSAGMAEVIKYGVIRDKELFEYLEIEKNKNELINLKNEYLIKIINSSIKTKSHIVLIELVIILIRYSFLRFISSFLFFSISKYSKSSLSLITPYFITSAMPALNSLLGKLFNVSGSIKTALG